MTADGTAHEPPNRELRLGTGTIIDGRFEITAFLGAGGMGSVYRARQLQFNREIAIKFLHRRYCEDVAAVKRFQREAKIVAKLQHKNILTAYAFGGYEGQIYLATEFVGGRSLGAIIYEKGPGQLEQALPLLLDICDAMEYAHQQGVLHRDLKPDNILIVTEPGKPPSAKVLDFGLSKLLGSNDAGKLTRTGEVVGDPRYMSPEQCQGQKLDERSDIYSFGCLMYEVFSGRCPFERDDVVAIMQCHISNEPEPFAQQMGLSSALEAICFTAMAKKPKDRYHSFQALSKHLREFQANPDLNISRPPGRLGRQKFPVPIWVLVPGVVSVLAVVALLALAPPHVWLARVGAAFSPEPEAKLENLLKLASFQLRQGQLTESAELYTNAAHLGEEQKNEEAILLSLSGLLNVRVQQGDDKEAIAVSRSLIAQAAQLLKGANVPTDTTNGAIRSGISELIRLDQSQALAPVLELADLYKARKMNREARSILELVATTGGDVHRGNNYFVLGQLALQDADKRAAISYFDRSITTAPKGSYRILTMQLVGSALMAAGDFKTALQYWNDLDRETYGKAYPGRSQLYMCMADCYANQHELQQAKQFYTSAASIEEKKPNPTYAVLLPSIHGAGLSTFELGDFAVAENLFRKEIMFMESQPSVDPKRLVTATSMLGDSLSFQKRGDAARQQYKRALDFITASPPQAELEQIRKSLIQKLGQQATGDD